MDAKPTGATASTDNDTNSGGDGDGPATQLAALAQARGWHRFGAFQAEYEKAARVLDARLVASTPSRSQWHRWLAGELRRLPYVNHGRVLEAMFPGWTAEQLFSPPTNDRPPPLQMLRLRDLDPASLPAVANPHADVAAIFASRTDFMDSLSPIEFFGQATDIRAAGLSLNMLCQHFADQRLRALVERGARLTALFLEPGGDAIEAREAEEGITTGHLSTLTSLNIDLLMRVRDGLPNHLRSNVEIKVYDEPIRYNLTFVDDQRCIVQPYLPAIRGVDSPTFLIHRSHDSGGLYEVFSRVFSWLDERSTPR